MSRQCQGKVKGRSRQGQGKVKARSRQGHGKVNATLGKKFKAPSHFKNMLVLQALSSFILE